MKDYNFNWFNSDYVSNYKTPKFPSSNSPKISPAAKQANLVAEQANQPSGERVLPLLRLSVWESNKQYDRNSPECIHYDFRWKASQRENTRARHVYSDADPDLVLAPSDFRTANFQARLEALLLDKDSFPGDKETTIDISVERSRHRGLKKRFKDLEIDWEMVDNHVEGLSALFSKRGKITISTEFIYNEAAGEPVAKGQKKKKRNRGSKASESR